MSELLPTLQAASIRTGLVDYLTTTFALADAEVRDGLDRFLSDPETGMFKGPYVRLRLPFRPAEDGWRDALEWAGDFVPYGHQAAAFTRLSTQVGAQRRRPLPTLVTTGTGSGKTEAFLYPILDHVLRARRDGITGMKALILYPMNALANDQAQRLARLITGRPELSAVTAALYTGEAGSTRTSVSGDGLITDRAVIRDSTPDILLTNYKMLDQLLLRSEDQQLWRRSATSLTYLVLDEFHTYDGAQGTDVAMLLRRLGLAIKSHWVDGDPAITGADRARPLGRITPVATSATLGDKSDSGVMLGFAETVFGEPFGPESIVTESRLSLQQWSGAAREVVDGFGLTPLDADRIDPAAARLVIDALGPEPGGERLARAVFGFLYDGPRVLIETADTERLLLLSKAHWLVRRLAAAASDAIALDDLVHAGVDEHISFGRHGHGRDWVAFLSYLVAALGHVRTQAGRGALSVETHLWVRELTRIDRAADTATTFRWSDDGPPVAGADHEEPRPSFPAIYCRHCGRSGWGVGLAPVGTGLATDDASIRRDHAQREGRFRALIYARSEAEAEQRDGNGEAADGLMWFSVRARSLNTHRPTDDDPEFVDGWILPVLTTTGADADTAAKDDDCPACGQADGIRFLGSAIATLLSVSLSTLFGSADLDAAEKKALVFTDSVQDAAHRAGFVQARSHTLTLRGVLYAAIAAAGAPLSLDQLADDVIRAAGDDAFARYRILAPELADRASFEPFWSQPTARSVPAAVRRRVRTRLALDVALEFGLNSRTGRTLELTGSAAVEVDVGRPPKIASAARAALEGFAWPGRIESTGDEPDDATLVRWVRGVLDRMRAQGAIDHPWFIKYRHEDGNRWWVTGGRPRGEGMPAFGRGRPSPGYPRVGGTREPKSDSLDPVTSTRSWYAIWTGRVLDVTTHDAALLARRLLAHLADDGVLTTVTTDTGAGVYAIPPDRVLVAPTTTDALAAGGHLLVCDTCRAAIPGSTTTIDQLDGAPCLVVRCHGRLRRGALAPGFYRRLYASPDMRRVVAREHTSLLDDKTRLAYENGFKAAATSPQAPNVLVATPTLEMGIDIGDLSTVFLASLPRTVASYLQRVGRAGRLTGNALDLAYITGRGEHLPKLGDPLSVINGEVRPPATYLQAEEILRRQYVAHLADHLARDAARPHPRTAPSALASSEPGTFLGDLIAFHDADADAHVARFADAFGERRGSVIDALRVWAQPVDGPGTSGLAAHLYAASQRWTLNVENLRHRLESIEAVIPELAARAESPAATDDDKRAHRSAQAAHSLTAAQLGHLRGEYWIGVLEEYGVLPNYTLLGDAVMLDVGISWVDPDTNTFSSEHAQIQRGSANAIREFAPGATFYARGLEIDIDAIDLGIDGTSIRPWVFCPACGYAADIELSGQAHSPVECPRCGSTAIADTGQRIDLVELTRVSAEVRRDEAAISDRRDERRNKNFEILLAADTLEAGRRWYVAGTGLGCTYARVMDLRWINFGNRAHGTTRTISGQDVTGGLFRVCAGCGKLDIVPGRNMAYEHRPWCPHRGSATEHNVLLALSRTLRTQGVMLRLPYAITLGDDFALPSLSAALLLGLREQLGGHTDHIAVSQAVEATRSDGSDNHAAILLHDIVPGGTGYLAELTDPGRMRELLQLAWQRVRDCECRHEDRLACHRCLLPFARPNALARVSRASAERHLQALLQLPDDAVSGDESTWHTTDAAPADDVESHLEQHFRKVVIKRLETAGAAITQIPGASGNVSRFTMPGGSRQWTLTPQVPLEGCKPDFVLASNDMNVPDVAIFTDGRAYHASETHNRLADDAVKRANLRATGRIVLAVTAWDLEHAESGQAEPPPWYSSDTVGQLITQPSLQAKPAAYEALRGGPIDWLLRWVDEPSPSDVRTVARAVPMFLLRSAQQVGVPDRMSLGDVAACALSSEPLTGSRSVLLYRVGALAAAIELGDGAIGCAAVIDDRPGRLDGAHADAWRSWLRLSNVLALRDWPTTISTVSGVATLAPATPGERPAVAAPAMDVVWAAAYDLAAPGAEQGLIVDLAGHPGVAVPDVGIEGPDGIPLDICWFGHRIAVDVNGMPAQDRADLEAQGWTVLAPDADAILTELGEATIEAPDPQGDHA